MKKLLYFSPVPWDSYKQRPHFFIDYFLNKGYQIIWVDPYPSRLPKLRDFFGRANFFNRKTPCPIGVNIIKLTVLPIEPLPWFNRINLFLARKKIQYLRTWLQPDAVLGIGKPSLIAMELLQSHQGVSFCDVMDDFPAFHHGMARKHLQIVENKIIQKAQKILVSSTNLEVGFLKKKLFATKIFNAFDNNDIIRLPNEKPSVHMLGYIGTIAEWFDWDLVIQIAQHFPMLTIQLIGPVYTALPKNLPGNVVLLGPIMHSEVAKYLHQFTLGLIPFKLNQLTKSVDPIKYYEYRAVGLPVISTGFGEMAYRNHEAGVFLIEKTNFSSVIERALHYVDSIEQVEAFRQSHAWSKRLTRLDTFDF